MHVAVPPPSPGHDWPFCTCSPSLGVEACSNQPHNEWTCCKDWLRPHALWGQCARHTVYHHRGQREATGALFHTHTARVAFFQPSAHATLMHRQLRVDPSLASCVQSCSSVRITGLCILPNISEAAPSFITTWAQTSTAPGYLHMRRGLAQGPQPRSHFTQAAMDLQPGEVPTREVGE